MYICIGPPMVDLKRVKIQTRYLKFNNPSYNRWRLWTWKDIYEGEGGDKGQNNLKNKW